MLLAKLELVESEIKNCKMFFESKLFIKVMNILLKACTVDILKLKIEMDPPIYY